VAGNGNVRTIDVGQVFVSTPTPYEIAGSLIVSEPITAFSPFARPITVDGDCSFTGTQLTVFNDATTGLAHVGGTFTASHNPLLQEIAFGTIGRGADLEDNAVLRGVNFFGSGFSQATEYPGDFIITDNPMLGNLEALFERIERIHGEVRIERNAGLRSMFAASLTTVDNLVMLEDNPQMFELGLPSLRTATAEIAVIGNDAITTLALPALQSADEIEIMQNATLGHLELPALTRASMLVENNPVLAACEVDAVFGRATGAHTQSGNGGTAPCAPGP
jgi:hypothetical protein